MTLLMEDMRTLRPIAIERWLDRTTQRVPEEAGRRPSDPELVLPTLPNRVHGPFIGWTPAVHGPSLP
jgi:hypothetical protein